MGKQYEIRDPVYGFINFNEFEKEIIAHCSFQRLRRIKQLGIADMVYPGAVHTRFEHSLGVMHLADQMYNVIINKDSNRKILEEKMSIEDPGRKRDRQLIRLAALLHDIGHAPFSHASENIMPLNENDKPYAHEDYTIAIIKESSLADTINDNRYNKSNFNITAEEVAALIEGNAFILKDKILWKLLISSQLDADRCDYLLRDSHHVGVKYGIYDHSRLINTLSLGIDPESDEIVLGVDSNGWHIAESILIARYQMFTQVYFHKTVRAYDYLLNEATKSVLDGGMLPAPNEIASFLKLDDTDLWYRFKCSKNDYCKSILNRDHIRNIYSSSEVPKPAEEGQIESIRRILSDKTIWFYEDSAKKSWYKLNDNYDIEIMIIDRENGAKPLSIYSSIVRDCMTKGVNQIRLYVKPEDRYNAECELDGQF